MKARRLRNRSGDAVFLCYHSIAADGPPFLSVSPEAFERHLALLKRLGFRSGSVSDLGQLVQGRRPDAKLAFLTFDDGYVDTDATARPLLDAYGFKAIVHVIPPLVDAAAPLVWKRVEHHAEAHPELMRAMDWQAIEALAADGHEIGSHTLSHARLPDLDDEALRTELADSRSRIAERLGRCDVIAYPFGLWSPRVAAAAGAAGYSYAFTLPYGAQPAADALSIPRINVDHRDDERRFRLKLTPAYRAFLLSNLKPAIRRVLGRRPSHESAA